MHQRGLTIGELSRRTGAHRETIRYYERIGLLRSPERTSGGHRVFYNKDIEQLTLVLRARRLGFTTQDTRQIITVMESDDHCDQMRAIAETQIKVTQQRITELRTLSKALENAVSLCASDHGEICPVVDCLLEE